METPKVQITSIIPVSEGCFKIGTNNGLEFTVIDDPEMGDGMLLIYETASPQFRTSLRTEAEIRDHVEGSPWFKVHDSTIR
jgi:hypothetical protein